MNLTSPNISPPLIEVAIFADAALTRSLLIWPDPSPNQIARSTVPNRPLGPAHNNWRAAPALGTALVLHAVD